MNLYNVKTLIEDEDREVVFRYKAQQGFDKQRPLLFHSNYTLE